MTIWGDWHDAMRWLYRHASGDCWILTNDWIDGQVSILKYDSWTRNVFYYAKWLRGQVL